MFVVYRSGRAGCLINEPSTQMVNTNYSAVMPGELMDGDKQCELQYGPTHKACKTNVSFQEFCSLRKNNTEA